MEFLPTYILKPLAFLFVLTVVIFIHELHAAWLHSQPADA
jgi:hypothetical protein